STPLSPKPTGDSARDPLRAARRRLHSYRRSCRFCEFPPRHGTEQGPAARPPGRRPALGADWAGFPGPDDGWLGPRNAQAVEDHAQRRPDRFFADVLAPEVAEASLEVACPAGVGIGEVNEADGLAWRAAAGTGDAGDGDGDGR